jgi:hypothetical protein
MAAQTGSWTMKGGRKEQGREKVREGEGESEGWRKSIFSLLLLFESAMLLMRRCVTTN